MKNGIVKDAVLLFLITLVAGLALGLVHEITAAPIEAAHIASANATYKEVFPDAASFDAPAEITDAVASCQDALKNEGFGSVSINDARAAYDAQGNVIGYLVDATSKDGYNGDVTISLGISTDKKITGIGFLSISETPGLGMKATEPDFRNQFPGKDASGELGLVKSGATDTDIQALSGASHTSEAVHAASNAAIWFVNNYCD